jgi:hypothetical protein
LIKLLENKNSRLKELEKKKKKGVNGKLIMCIRYTKILIIISIKKGLNGSLNTKWGIMAQTLMGF